MPLFRILPAGQNRDGQLQEVMCPRCKEKIKDAEITSAGGGENMRRVEGTYRCPCSYRVTVVETYPVINLPQE